MTNVEFSSHVVKVRWRERPRILQRRFAPSKILLCLKSDFVSVSSLSIDEEAESIAPDSSVSKITSIYEPSRTSRAERENSLLVARRAEQVLPGSFANGEKGLLAHVLGSFGSFMMLASFARLVANLVHRSRQGRCVLELLRSVTYRLLTSNRYLLRIFSRDTVVCMPGFFAKVFRPCPVIRLCNTR